MSDILIKSKAIPSNPRSKNYPAGAVVSSAGGGGTTVVTGGGGSSIDILKVDDMRSLTDRNVLSSLRALQEIKARIIAMQDDKAIFTDDNVLSSLRTIAEILSRIVKSNDINTELSEENTLSSLRIIDEINKAIKKAEEFFLSKKNDDTAAGLITFLQGLVSKGLIQANAGLVVRKQELEEEALLSLIEENEDALVEELSTSGSNTIGELDNVSLEADTAPNGSILVKEEDIWSPVPPIVSDLTDYDNMLMPVFHKVLGKWVFISVSSISGGVTPPVSLEMILDSGVLDRDTLGTYDNTGAFVLDNSKLDQSKLI